MIIYLNSTDQAAQDTALVAAEVCQINQDQEGVDIAVPVYGYTVDTIGTIYAPDTSGAVYTIDNPYVPVAMSGWHANIMGDFTPEQLALLPTIPTPNNPVRMFAGAGK